MASEVLTLKYRPQSFDELWVQDHVRDTLKRAIERNRLANAYLFCGPRGVGKTTTARILAKSLNCEKGPTATPCNKCPFCTEITASRSMDVIEIDGASNRGIEQIRELRENIKYTPSSGRYKIYIIDEVHMLTEAAFNALLKTLEEPPAHAKFVFATTAAHDVPATIVSRCQRFDFRRATPAEIKDRLAWLAQQEKIKASDAALMAIARRADGAIRDAEGILDQLASFRPDGIELKDVEELLGLVPSEVFFDYADLVLAGDAPGLMAFLARLLETG
ncbi:MAG: DNA polymerase III subunit gamma/tau [candidate division WOR-3 bacterium]|nr:DNA polymerase III subunit gamma/tau [candidate division WOR-3 bacterium]